MSVLTVRNAPPEVHRALRLRAAQQGRSAEAEVRAILESGIKRPERVKLGSSLFRIVREATLTDREVAGFSSVQEKSVAKAARFK